MNDPIAQIYAHNRNVDRDETRESEKKTLSPNWNSFISDPVAVFINSISTFQIHFNAILIMTPVGTGQSRHHITTTRLDKILDAGFPFV